MMEKQESKTSFTIRVNSQTKSKADQIASKLGISLTAAINMFVEQFVRDEGMPFKPTTVRLSPYHEDDLDADFVTMLKRRVTESLSEPGMSVAELQQAYDYHQNKNDEKI